MINQSNCAEIIEEIIKFRDERDWEQFHNIKDLSIGLSIEASELLELFLWKTPEEIDQLLENPEYKEIIEEELADILIFCFLISHTTRLDIKKIISKKLQKNSLKYPVEKSKGIAKKYNGQY